MCSRWMFLWLSLLGCGESEESGRVSHPIVVDGRGIVPVTTDLGYSVTVTRLRSVLRDVRFTQGGETHASVWPLGWLVGVAHAHPGHGAGGEVLGELPGRFVIDWLADDGRALGEATMLEGTYDGADFTFTGGTTGDGLDASDPLVGETFDVAGHAEKGGRTVEFAARLNLGEGTELVGAPFAAEVGDDEAAYGLQLTLKDPFEADTVFDGIDFDALGDGPVTFEVGTTEHNKLRRNLRLHDHWRVEKR